MSDDVVTPLREHPVSSQIETVLGSQEYILAYFDAQGNVQYFVGKMGVGDLCYLARVVQGVSEDIIRGRT